jgi:hypothetical protein
VTDVEALVKAEVEKARRILREDKVLGKLNKHFPDEPETEPDDGKPKPPGKKPEPEDGVPEKKPGIWWGENV